MANALRAWLTASCAAASCAALVACSSDPEPRQGDPEAPAHTPAAQPAQPAPAEAPAAQPTAPVEQQPRLLIVTAKPFPEEVMSILPGDLVEVTLQTGGRTSGWVTTLRPRELAITAEGTRIITRLTPEAVRSVKVTYRPPRLISSDGAGGGREGWLPHNYVRLVLEGLPQETWSGLLGRNVPLTVARQFSVATWDHLEQADERSLFAAVETPTTLQPGDQLKLAAVVRGAQKLRAGAERPIGDVFVLLLKREERITQLFTTDAIHPSDLERQDLVRYLKDEPVTVIVYRPQPPVVYAKIARVPRSAARAYMQRVELLPDRAVLRQWRAAKDPQVQKVEGRIKALHDALGLAPDDQLRNGPLVMEMRLPTLHGSLFILPFRKEFGLD